VSPSPSPSESLTRYEGDSKVSRRTTDADRLASHPKRMGRFAYYSVRPTSKGWLRPGRLRSPRAASEARYGLGPGCLGSQSNRRHFASGRRVWCDLSLDVAGVGGGPVATCVVGVDASPGAVWALTWAADEARLWLASLEVVRP
jgi:hypothetical protein